MMHVLILTHNDALWLLDDNVVPASWSSSFAVEKVIKLNVFSLELRFRFDGKFILEVFGIDMAKLRSVESRWRCLMIDEV